MLSRILTTFAALSFAAAAAACSSGAGSDGASDNADAVPTSLSGLYTEASAGTIQWISFSGANKYALEYDRAECDPDMVPASCVSQGTYTIDTDAKTITLKDITNGDVTSFPLGVVSAEKTTSGGNLLTQDESLVSSGGPLTTPSSISLTQGGTSQKLVSSPSTTNSCPASGSAAASSMQSSTCSMSGSEVAGGPTHDDGRTRHGIMKALCVAATLLCAGCDDVQAIITQNISPSPAECEFVTPVKDKPVAGAGPKPKP